MLLQVIEQLKLHHEHYLEQLVKRLDIPAPIIRQALFYCLFPGGKRIRPLLVYLVGQVLEVSLNILDVLAAAIELTHCYSLIHDDLPAMDNDDLRRGKASCHKAFDEATAILLGDGLQAIAIEILLEGLSPLLDAEKIIAITLALTKASGPSGMVSGQALDLSELTKSRIDEEKLCQIHQLKTGKLLCACVEMILASLPFVEKISQSALRHYAAHLGLVFQLQDDYLDHYAATALGKNRSSDLANHKLTFASLYTKEQLEEKINHHYQIALNALSPLGSKNRALVEFTEQLQARTNL